MVHCVAFYIKHKAKVFISSQISNIVEECVKRNAQTNERLMLDHINHLNSIFSYKKRCNLAVTTIEGWPVGSDLSFFLQLKHFLVK